MADQQDMLDSLLLDYVNDHIKRTGKAPTPQDVSDMHGFISKDIANFSNQGMPYESGYIKSFVDAANNPGNLNNDAVRGGRAYELSSNEKLRRLASGLGPALRPEIYK